MLHNLAAHAMNQRVSNMRDRVTAEEASDSANECNDNAEKRAIKAPVEVFVLDSIDSPAKPCRSEWGGCGEDEKADDAGEHRRQLWF